MANLPPSTENESDQNPVYDPHEHRQNEVGQSTFQAICNLVKLFLGTGVLALPMAFNNAGYIPGIVMLLGMAALSSYCGKLMVDAQTKICIQRRVPILLYPETLRYALENGPSYFRWYAPYAIFTIRLMFCFGSFGILIVYLLFCAESIQQLVKEYSGHTYPIQYFLEGLLLPLIVVTSIKKLSNIGWISFFANIVTIGGLAIIAGYMIKDLNEKKIDFGDRKFIGPFQKFPIYFGTVCFAFAATTLVLTVSSDLKKPKSFLGICGAWNLSLIITTSIYICFGVLGYTTYATEAKSIVILNLSYGLETSLIRGFYALAIFLSYPINAYVAIEIITTLIEPHFCKGSKHWVLEYLIPFTVVILSFIMALVVPNIGVLISLTGALSVPFLAFMFPAWLDYLTHYPDISLFRLIQTILLTLFSTLAVFLGSALSIREII